jgi:hypothetical protein
MAEPTDGLAENNVTVSVVIPAYNAADTSTASRTRRSPRCHWIATRLWAIRINLTGTRRVPNSHHGAAGRRGAASPPPILKWLLYLPACTNSCVQMRV